MRRPLTLLSTAALVAGAGTAFAAQPRSGPGPGHPALPAPSHFVRTIDNPWFPLLPGTVLRYKGADEGTPSTDVLRVTRRTKRILGVRTTVVDDRVYTHGRLEERTKDWYAQDDEGNVWYLGEDTATLKPDGSVDSREGSWQAGVGGGRAGIFMPAQPRRGQAGEQEHDKGQAEDEYKILRKGVHVSTPAVTTSHAMLVQETTPLEPKVLDHKVYVRGIGTVREVTVKGGNERLDLVSVHRPSRGR